MSDASAQAAQLKHRGNELYKRRRFAEAVEVYNEAITLAPSAVLFSDRSACHLALKRLQEAERDAEKAIELDPSWYRGHLRVASCQVKRGVSASQKCEAAWARALACEQPAAQRETLLIERTKSRHDLLATIYAVTGDRPGSTVAVMTVAEEPLGQVLQLLKH